MTSQEFKVCARKGCSRKVRSPNKRCCGSTCLWAYIQGVRAERLISVLGENELTSRYVAASLALNRDLNEINDVWWKLRKAAEEVGVDEEKWVELTHV